MPPEQSTCYTIVYYRNLNRWAQPFYRKVALTDSNFLLMACFPLSVVFLPQQLLIPLELYDGATASWAWISPRRAIWAPKIVEKCQLSVTSVERWFNLKPWTAPWWWVGTFKKHKNLCLDSMGLKRISVQILANFRKKPAFCNNFFLYISSRWWWHATLCRTQWNVLVKCSTVTAVY